jgi:pyruvate kinase
MPFCARGFIMTIAVPDPAEPVIAPDALLETLVRLRAEVDAEGRRMLARWRPGIHRRAFLPSALNLAHYVALRRRDLRWLQGALMPYGLSSLGRLEARVLPNLDAVIAALGRIADASIRHPFPPPRVFFRGERLLKHNAAELFGPAAGPRNVHILVTLPTEAATEPELLEGLLAAGADAVRINCAHDDSAAWEAMIGHLRRAERATGRTARILMDLGGPKCRTGAVCLREDRKHLFPGDRLLLTRSTADFVPLAEQPFQAECTLPTVLDRIAPGHRVFVDDGRFGGTVETVRPSGAMVHITHALPQGGKLKPAKGLNFPDTDLGLSPLTDKDRVDLDFVAAHADMIGYSFVQNAADIALLQDELAQRRPDWRRIGLVAKIETPRAIHNLPELMVQAASHQPFAVMIARGDLAVEIGFERLAEMQEEMLWLCEAAHVPVIWATQVLESMIRKGLPSRGEMTDAAMAGRAECVMLNKGPYMAEAVAALDRLLARMAEHQLKKTPRLRALRSW